MRNPFFLLGAACLVLAAFGLVYFTQHPESSDTRGLAAIEIADTPLRVSVMDTPALRTQGLSGRSGLPEGEGMLFVFPKDGFYGFWMKDMLFSIDIIWASADGEVVHIEKDVSPETYPRVFTPSRQARYVLEIPAGFSSEHGIEIGSKLDFPRAE